MPRSSLVGQVLSGRYRVDELVGQGGMSAVYRAYDPNLKRVVAIKTVHSHLAADPRFLARFEEEAAAVAHLRHPNIVQVFDFSHDEDQYYMVQEYLVGETLQEHLRRLNKAGKRMPLPEALGVALQIGDALGYAHRRGMIHRDVKPANIMLEIQGQAILMDFGIVKMTGSERHTASGAVLGTALYMPPELIQGEVPDARSDLYSLGVTLYEMVSGRPPFEADSTVAVMMMQLHDAPPELRALRPGVPDPLIAVIEKMLAKSRDQRYGSMAELAVALREVQGRLEGAAVPVVMVNETPKAAVAPNIPVAPSQPVARGPAAIEPSHAPLTAAGRPATDESGKEPGPASQVRSIELGAAGVSSGKRPGIRPVLWIGGAMLVLFIIAGGLFALLRSPGQQGIPPTATPGAALQTGGPFARITGITVDNQQRYVVEYEISGFTAQASGLHLHFFFDNVPPEQAGTPGNGLSTDYAGTSPFAQIKQSDRPETASQLCVLVANPDQSVRLNSGTCSILPDVATAVALQDTTCLSGPGTAFPPAAQLKAGQVALVRGLSQDQAWWNVVNPENTGETCWLFGENIRLNGDVSKVPVVGGSPQPTGTVPVSLSVEIVHIGLDNQGHYVVDFQTSGFAAQLPGTHIHFFFDTVPPDQVGASGDNLRLMYGGPPPFTGYSRADRPAEAVRMCALVANPDHSVLPGSGNCVILPDAP